MQSLLSPFTGRGCRQAGEGLRRRGKKGFVATITAVLLAFLLPVATLAADACPQDGQGYPPLHTDAARFEAAMAGEEAYPPSPVRLTGITVPHHLVAGHLIARGFRAASAFPYRRVIVLTPDHFSRATGMFATTRHGFDTVFGAVETDTAAVDALLASAAGVEESCLFGHEHGLQALLPFLRRHLPGAALVPVAISNRARRADWDRLADALAPLAGRDTLVVQSTDFSHYHPHAVARQLDQQVLNVLAEGDPGRIALLRQPDHLDSVGGMYVQMALQRAVHGASPAVIASENQQEHSRQPLSRTTGYLVILFSDFPDGIVPHEPGAELVYFAGDTLFGRAIAPALSDADAAERVAGAVLLRTGGRPLVVNLEGVILPNVPEALPHLTLAMPAALTLPWLTRLNVVAVGLANNHAMDLGEAGFTETVAALDGAGIRWFGQGGRLDVGRLAVVGLTDIDGNGPPYTDLIGAALLDRISAGTADRPVVAFVHWGREYVAAPSPRERELAEAMRLAGAAAIVGAHPHVASDGLTAPGGGEALMVHSLGNFLFDQSARTASGALLEVRTFRQGTFFARLIPLPNLFDLARSVPR